MRRSRTLAVPVTKRKLWAKDKQGKSVNQNAKFKSLKAVNRRAKRDVEAEINDILTKAMTEGDTSNHDQ